MFSAVYLATVGLGVVQRVYIVAFFVWFLPDFFVFGGGIELVERGA